MKTATQDKQNPAPDREIFLAAQAGDRRALDRLVRRHYPLAISIASKFPHLGEFEDRLQDALIGLVDGIRRFDPDKGFAFSTYSTWWIKHHVRRGHESLIRLPVHRKESNAKLAKAAAKALALGQTPSELPLSFGRRSLDAPDRLGLALHERLAADPEGGAPGMDLRALKWALLALSWTERDVLQGRFVEDLTLQEIGEKLGLSRERIRQIQVQALSRLRAEMEKEKVNEQDQGQGKDEPMTHQPAA